MLLKEISYKSTSQRFNWVNGKASLPACLYLAWIRLQGGFSTLQSCQRCQRKFEKCQKTSQHWNNSVTLSSKWAIDISCLVILLATNQTTSRCRSLLANGARRGIGSVSLCLCLVWPHLLSCQRRIKQWPAQRRIAKKWRRRNPNNSTVQTAVQAEPGKALTRLCQKQNICGIDFYTAVHWQHHIDQRLTRNKWSLWDLKKSYSMMGILYIFLVYV